MGTCSGEELPINLKDTLQKAPDVVTVVNQDRLERRRNYLEVMSEMEKARETKGNFCITIGKDENRVLLLIAPINRSEKSTGQTFTDYVLITTNGPRRLSLDDNPKVNGYAGYSERNRNISFKRHIENLLRDNRPHEKGEYKEEIRDGYQKLSLYFGDTYFKEFFLSEIPSGCKTELTPEQEISTSEVGVVSDGTIVMVSLEKSLAMIRTKLQRVDTAAQKDIGIAARLHSFIKSH